MTYNISTLHKFKKKLIKQGYRHITEPCVNEKGSTIEMHTLKNVRLGELEQILAGFNKDELEILQRDVQLNYQNGIGKRSASLSLDNISILKKRAATTSKSKDYNVDLIMEIDLIPRI